MKRFTVDGTKVEKIVGDDYVIDLKNKSMYVGGNFDLMVEGDYNINVKGNKYEHVSGHSYNVIKGNRLNKIQGHELIDTESTYHMMVGGNFNCQVGVTDKDKKSMGNYRLRVTNQMNQTIQGKHKIFGGQDFKHVVKGDFHVNTTLRTGPDPDALLDLAKGGSVGADAFVSGGSIKLEAIKKIDLNTFVTKLPKVPGSPVGSQISLVSDRINQTAQVDMVERIGPVAPPSFVQMIGNKKTFVMNPTGVGGIQNYLAGAGVIENNITGIGAINNFVVGAGFINNAIAGAGTISNVTGAALPGTFGTPAAVLAGTTTQIMTNASILTVTPTVGITAITNNLGATTVTGVGLVNGALTVTGLVTGGTTILQTHVHSVGGSAAPSTGTPI